MSWFHLIGCQPQLFPTRKESWVMVNDLSNRSIFREVEEEGAFVGGSDKHLEKVV